MTRKKCFLFLLVLGLLVYRSAPASAQTMAIGVEDLGYRPYYYLENGRYQGAAREILDAFAAKTGVRFDFQPLPVNRLYKEFLSGNLDFKFPDNPNWKPDEKAGLNIHYSQPVLDFTDGIMVKPENLGKGLDSLKVLGTVLGFTTWGYLDRIDDGKIRLIENASFSGLLEQVIAGRVDGAYMNPVVARYQLEQVLKKPGALVFDPSLPNLSDAYRLSSGKHPDLIADFDRFLREEADSIRGIKERYRIVH